MRTFASDRAMRSISCASSPIAALVPISCPLPWRLMLTSVLPGPARCFAASPLFAGLSQGTLRELSPTLLVHADEHGAKRRLRFAAARDRRCAAPERPARTAPSRRRPACGPSCRPASCASLASSAPVRLMSTSRTLVRTSSRHSSPSSTATRGTRRRSAPLVGCAGTVLARHGSRLVALTPLPLPRCRRPSSARFARRAPGARTETRRRSETSARRPSKSTA